MNATNSQTLAGVLSAWGHREATSGKPGTDLLLPAVSLGYLADGIDAILRHAPQLIARILLAEPIDVLQAEFRPEDCRRLFPCNFAGSTMVDLAERWWLE